MKFLDTSLFMIDIAMPIHVISKFEGMILMPPIKNECCIPYLRGVFLCTWKTLESSEDSKATLSACKYLSTLPCLFPVCLNLIRGADHSL